MKLRRILPVVLLIASLSFASRVQAETRTLDIYFIDVDGGAAQVIHGEHSGKANQPHVPNTITNEPID